jgi:hypothetical protein
MAELLCGALPEICRTVAAHHRRINAAIGASDLDAGPDQKIFSPPP